MSFDVANKSGEVVPLDPVDFLQFAGIGGAVKAVSSAFPKVLQRELSEVASNFGSKAPFKIPFVDQIKNFFAKPAVKAGTAAAGGGGAVAATTIPRQVTQVATKSGISIVDKTLIGTGIVGGTTLGTVGILSLTPGGQQVTTTAGNILDAGADIGKTITNTLSNNPIILIALIGLGALLVIKK